MLNRIFFTLLNSIKYYAQIKKLKKNSLNNIAAISLEYLNQRNIQILVLDFDGVLASHGEDVPCKTAEDFLDKVYSIFHKNIFILSNKPTETRKKYFNKNYPDISFIKAGKKKPYPDGLNQIINLAQVTPQEVVLVDDRLLTGGLAAILANAQIIYIRRPFVDYSKRLFFELFFQSLRVLERLVF